MDDAVIAIAGPIGSGKTTVSSAVARALNLPRASFGDHVRTVAKQRGLAPGREALQVIGSELIQEGWRIFCQAVLSEAGWRKGSGVVIDGLRHIEAIDAILEVTGTSSFVLVFISITNDSRRERLVAKGIRDKETQRRVEGHSTEGQMDCLRDEANLVVDGTRPTEELVSQVIGFVMAETATQ